MMSRRNRDSMPELTSEQVLHRIIEGSLELSPGLHQLVDRSTGLLNLKRVSSMITRKF